MSLNYDITACADMDELKASTPRGWPITEALIFATCIIGLRSITEKNAAEFFTRLRMWETAIGPLMLQGGMIEPDEVRARIGLRTNASEMTQTQYRQKLFTAGYERASRTWAD